MPTVDKKNIYEILGRNPIHPFPARMAPGIALEALGNGAKSLRVLDPMAGSGTVLAVARSKGHKAIGFDLDPLAVLLAGVWTQTIKADSVRNKALEVLSRAMERFELLSPDEAFPVGCDKETKAFLLYWFDDNARRQLTSLAGAIGRVHDKTIRRVLWSAFSRLIITKTAGASLAMDLSHSRPHRRFQIAPVEPFDRFLSAVETVVVNCPKSGAGMVGPAAVVKRGDARKLAIRKGSIDLVLTSPPYLNAIDYMRCSKFSLVWMGYSVGEIRKIRGESVGAEVSLKEALNADWVTDIIAKLELEPMLSTRNYALLARYTWDMGHALAEASRVLKKGGRAVYVVGDSTIRGTFVRNSEIVALVGKRNGLSIDSRHCRTLPANRRYMPPPKSILFGGGMDARMREEVVLAFTKV
jgi:SAM-dependent methyltransferase